MDCEIAPVVRLRLTLAYEGTRYAGWQMQAPCPGGKETVQAAVERALAGIIGSRVPVHAAGRTDAGVHAEAQVCHADVPIKRAGMDWVRALNTKLEPDIRIFRGEIVPRSFHSRKNAKAKVYAYSLWTGRNKALPRVQAFVWSVPALDVSSMTEAAAHLLGRHDFSSFQNTGTPLRDTVREIITLDMVPGRIGPLACPREWPVFTLLVRGDGFLKQMVRNIAGMLVWAGLGKVRPADVPGILAARDRRALPSPSAPAQGLTLMEVIY